MPVSTENYLAYEKVVNGVLDPTGRRTAKLCVTPFLYDRELWEQMDRLARAYANLLEFVFQEFPQQPQDPGGAGVSRRAGALPQRPQHLSQEPRRRPDRRLPHRRRPAHGRVEYRDPGRQRGELFPRGRVPGDCSRPKGLAAGAAHGDRLRHADDLLPDPGRGQGHADQGEADDLPGPAAVGDRPDPRRVRHPDRLHQGARPRQRRARPEPDPRSRTTGVHAGRASRST